MTRRKTIPLSEFIDSLRQSEGPQYRVFLVSGSAMRRENIISNVQAAAKSAWDTLMIRLDENITASETDFSPHLMKALAQELSEKEGSPRRIDTIIQRYLNPFEVSEVTKKGGFNYLFSASKEQKSVKREVHDDDIRQDFFECLAGIQELQWKTFLAISSIQGFSSAASRYTLKFLLRGHNFVIFGGESEQSLDRFVDELGIPENFPAKHLVFDSVRAAVKDGKKEERGISEEVAKVVRAITNGFATESRRFSFLRFETRRQLLGSDLPATSFSFDTCIIGHLKMREDYPELIRTNYDCAFLVKVLHEPIRSCEELLRAADAAFEILLDGIVSDTGERCDPWDTFIFLVAPQIPDTVVTSYEHLGYRNMFVLLNDGTFRNLSRHTWLDVILAAISRRLAHSLKSSDL